MSDRELAKVIGNNISARRKKFGLTQAQLAESLDIGQDALSRMENGAISPKISRLRHFASSLHCSVADLFREPNENVYERSLAIAEELKELSPESQEAIMRIISDLVEQMVRKNTS